jgi:tRNA dimethylallyltransferase
VTAAGAPPPLPVVFVLGPTASGKTRLGVALARRCHGEILSFDSRQLYRGMDLGTGKDLAEYAAGPDGPAVPHHLIDLAAPTEPFDLHAFLPLAYAAAAAVRRRGALPIGVGGSVLYVKAFLDGYELAGGAPDPVLRAELATRSDAELRAELARLAPDLAARADTAPHRRLIRAVEIARTRASATGRAATAPARPTIRPLLLGPYYPRPELHRRIAERLDARLAAGLVAEVAGLHRRGVGWARLEAFGLEYRCVAWHLQGRLPFLEMRDRLLAQIRQFCRRQEIWFRKLEREGKAIHWIPGGDVARAEALVRRFLAGEALPPPELRLADIHYGPPSQ